MAADAQKVGTETKNFDCNPKYIFFVLRHEGEKEKFKSFRPHILIASIHKRAHSILNAPLFRIQHWYYSFFGREREKGLLVLLLSFFVGEQCVVVYVFCVKRISHF